MPTLMPLRANLITCGECRGKGTIRHRDCPACGGKGYRTQQIETLPVTPLDRELRSRSFDSTSAKRRRTGLCVSCGSEDLETRDRCAACAKEFREKRPSREDL